MRYMNGSAWGHVSKKFFWVKHTKVLVQVNDKAISFQRHTHNVTVLLEYLDLYPSNLTQ